MIYLLGHLVAAAGLGLLIYCAGRCVERACFGGQDLGALRSLGHWLLGILFWVVSAFGLASLDLLTTPALVALAVLVILFSARLTLREWHYGALRLSSLSVRPLDVVCGILAGATLVPVFLIASSPALSWDADVYHLTLPRIFLEAGGFREVPVLVYAQWPLPTEMLYAVAMGLNDYVSAKLLHFGLGILVLVVGASVVCRSLPEGSGAAAGWLVVAPVVINDFVAFELSVAYVEWMHAFALLAGVLFVSAARDAGEDRARSDSHLLLGGLACGLMAATKVTGIAWVPMVAAIYLPVIVEARRAGRARKSSGAFVCVSVCP